MQENLKFDKHISLTFNRANRIVGFIKCALLYLDEETLLLLYKTLIRPIHFSKTIWCPALRKDIMLLKMYREDSQEYSPSFLI